MAIGTTALLAGAAGLGSAVIQGSAAKKAANAQVDSARDQTQLHKGIYQDQKKLFAPYRNAGRNALDAYSYEMGLGERPTFGGSTPQIERYEIQAPAQQQQGGGGMAPLVSGMAGGDPLAAYDFFRGQSDNAEWGAPQNRLAPQPPQYGFRVGDRTFATRQEAQAYAESQASGGTPYRGFQATPGYQFMLDEGQRAIDGSAASSGGLFSGATMKASQAFGTGLANQEYGNYMNRLSGMAGSGQSAAGMQATAAGNMGQSVGNSMASIGNAQAAGSIGMGNAFNGGIENALSTYGYMTNLNNPAQATQNYAPTTSIRPMQRPWG